MKKLYQFPLLGNFLETLRYDSSESIRDLCSEIAMSRRFYSEKIKKGLMSPSPTTTVS